MTLLEELRQLIDDHHAHGLRAIDTTTLTQLVRKWSHPTAPKPKT